MFNRSVNKVVLVGNLGKDPEMRYMPNGGAVASLTLATTESWKDKQTGERKDKTEWHNLTVFGRLGEMCGEYLKKGAKIYAEGRLQTEKWQGQDGQARYTTKVVVSEIQMMDARTATQGTGQGQFQAAPQQSAPAQQSWGNAPQAPAQQAAPQMAPAYQPVHAQPSPAQPAPVRQAPAPQQQQQAPAQYNEPSMDFDDDIPF